MLGAFVAFVLHKKKMVRRSRFKPHFLILTKVIGDEGEEYDKNGEIKET